MPAYARNTVRFSYCEYENTYNFRSPLLFIFFFCRVLLAPTKRAVLPVEPGFGE